MTAGRPLRSVMVIEDSETMRGYIRMCLQAFFPGVQSLEVPSGFDALRLLPGLQVDLIITDINMPDMNGLELIRFLKTHPTYRQIPIVIVSTEGAAEDQRRGMVLGADAYVVKPFRPDHLAQVVRTIWLRYEQDLPPMPQEKPAWPPEN